MSQVIVNVTLPIVVAKIETALKDVTIEVQGEAHTTDLRQRLAAYVLRRLPVIYVTLDQESIRHRGTPSECYSYEQHRHIDHLIQQGLQAILNAEPIYAEGYARDAAAAVSSANSRLSQNVAAVSDWFG
ncbi:MAG: hypothetical protein RLZZ597_1376 [Cyanobacteriota bacterium]|jgi:hypothetical protein